MTSKTLESDYHKLLAQSIRSPRHLEFLQAGDKTALEETIRIFPMRINPYIIGLMQHPGDPIWRQVMPDPVELDDDVGVDDPLCEEQQSLVPNLIHRYPNRVVWLISDQCAVYCRHCMRKRRVGFGGGFSHELLMQGIDYIAKMPQVNDVILSGGDPLLLEDEVIFDLCRRLRRIEHVRIIRIHSRTPSTLPQRITPRLVEGLSRCHPLWFNTQFNHPMEITPQAEKACALLADAGIPVGCQTVLLNRVNDSPEILAELMEALLQIRVRPYYLHHPDRVRGTRHFWVSISRGLSIMQKLRGFLSGLAVPYYMVDLPGGAGKVPLLPESIVERRPGLWRLRNHQGRIVDYHLPELEGDGSV